MGLGLAAPAAARALSCELAPACARRGGGAAGALPETHDRHTTPHHPYRIGWCCSEGAARACLHSSEGQGGEQQEERGERRGNGRNRSTGGATRGGAALLAGHAAGTGRRGGVGCGGILAQAPRAFQLWRGGGGGGGFKGSARPGFGCSLLHPSRGTRRRRVTACGGGVSTRRPITWSPPAPSSRGPWGP